MIQLRLNTLLNTEALLAQKLTALLRRVRLSYVIDGHATPAASDSELNAILQEIEEAEANLEKSTLNVEKYSGGLVQVMALMTVETNRMSIAQLRLKFYSAKYGLPLLNVQADKKPIEAPGRVVKDRDAL